MYLFDNKQPAARIKDEIDRLRRLARDLERAQQGSHPSQRELDRAHFIDDWQFAYREEMCLVGIVKGHPEIDDGHFIRTSRLWLLSRTSGYARTLSRLYALGRPADEPYFRHS